jgi:hypothetical protein
MLFSRALGGLYRVDVTIAVRGQNSPVHFSCCCPALIYWLSVILQYTKNGFRAIIEKFMKDIK